MGAGWETLTLVRTFDAHRGPREIFLWSQEYIVTTKSSPIISLEMEEASLIQSFRE